MSDTNNTNYTPESDFDVSAEYKPAPLVPNGDYRGNVTKIELDTESNAIVWSITLDGNGGVMSDDLTPIDGSLHWYRNWLPAKGDEKEMTKDGKMTKRQAKINMLADFSAAMKISMNSLSEIHTALENQTWLGLSVMTSIETREYNGKVTNNIKKMRSA